MTKKTKSESTENDRAKLSSRRLDERTIAIGLEMKLNHNEDTTGFENGARNAAEDAEALENITQEYHPEEDEMDGWMRVVRYLISECFRSGRHKGRIGDSPKH